MNVPVAPASAADLLTPSRWRQWWGPAVVLSVLALALLYGWGKWVDVFVDAGREFYVPWQLHEGRLLYRELAYHHGPISPAINYLWFALLGVSVRSLVLGNLLLLGVTLGLLWRVLRSMGDELTATVGCVSFILLQATGQFTYIGNYNWLTPYSHEATHGMLLALGALATLQMRLRQPMGWGWPLLAGVLAGLAVLCKAELGLAIAAALAAGWLAGWWMGTLTWREGLLGSAGILLSWALVCGVLALHRPWSLALADSLGAWRYIGSGLHNDASYFQYYRGLSDWRGQTLRLLGASLFWLALGLAPLLPARGRRAAAPWRPWRVAVVALALGLTVWTIGAPAAQYGVLPLPLVLLALFVMLARLILRGRQRSASAPVLLLIWTIWALVPLLVRMPLWTRIEHYGFSLTFPGLMLLIWLGLYAGPRWWAARGGDGRLLRWSALAALVGLASVFMQVQHAYFARKTIAVSAGADRFYSDGRGEVMNALLIGVREHVKPGGTLVCLPDGEMLNFLSRRANPTPYGNFVPHQLEIFGEQTIIAALQQHPPDAVVYIARETAEYGPRWFGQDYGQALAQWISTHYEVVYRIGGSLDNVQRPPCWLAVRRAQSPAPAPAGAP